jgi:WD40 repeat protein
MAKTNKSRSSIFAVGGTVQASGGIYIPRNADEELFKLCRAGEFAYVLSPRQVGKSSLMVQTARRLADEGIESVIIDLNQLGMQLTADQWYLGLLALIEDYLQLDTDVVSWWENHHHLGITQRLVLFFEDVLLVEATKPVVIFIDEIDTTLGLGFTDDFFAAIRYFYNARALSADMRRLTFVLIGVATPSDLIRDDKRTPFNIGSRVELTDWTFEEALPLLSGFTQSAEVAKQVLRWVLKWTGGHPYLTMRLCSVIETEGRESWTENAVDELVRNTFLGEKSENDNNLQFVRDMLTEGNSDPERRNDLRERLTTYKEIYRNKREVVDEEQSLIKSHLKLSGVVVRDNRRLRIRNRIYQTVFDDAWIKEHLPVNWYKRARNVGYWLVITLVVLSFPTVIFAVAKSYQANKQKEIATQQKEIAETNLAEANRQKEIAETNAEEANRQRQIAVANENAANAAKAEANRQKVIAETNLTEANKQKEIANQQKEIAQKNAIAANTAKAEADRQANLAKESAADAKESAAEALRQQGIAETKAIAADTAKAEADRQANLAKESAAEALRQKGIADQALEVVAQLEQNAPNFKAVIRENKISIKNAMSDAQPEQKTGNEAAKPASVRAVMFREDGKQLVTADDKGKVQTWELDGTNNFEPKPLEGPSINNTSIDRIEFSHDGKYIFTVGKEIARIWDTQDKQAIEIKGTAVSARTVAFNEQEHSFLVAREEEKEKGKEKGYIPIKQSQIVNKENPLLQADGKHVEPQIVTHHDKNLIFTIDSNGKGIIAKPGEEKSVTLQKFRNPFQFIFHLPRSNINFVEEKVTKAEFSPDGKLLVTVSGKKARVWDTASGIEQFRRRGHENDITTLAFSKDGKYVVTAGKDGMAWVWEAATGVKVSELHDHRGLLITFKKGTIIPPVDYSAMVHLRRKNIIPLSFSALRWKKLKPITSVAFSPDNQLVVTGDEDGLVRVWDRESGTKMTDLRGHLQATINSARFSPDGKLIVTAAEDGTTRIWDVCGNSALLDKPEAKHLKEYCEQFGVNPPVVKSKKLTGNKTIANCR